jgi:hypothetical protein
MAGPATPEEAPMHKTILIAVEFDEDEDHTDASATATLNDREFLGAGRARRNRVDPNVPAIGEELALSRALADLSHRLLSTATDDLEVALGRPVAIQL